MHGICRAIRFQFHGLCFDHASPAWAVSVLITPVSSHASSSCILRHFTHCTYQITRKYRLFSSSSSTSSQSQARGRDAPHSQCRLWVYSVSDFIQCGSMFLAVDAYPLVLMRAEHRIQYRALVPTICPFRTVLAQPSRNSHVQSGARSSLLPCYRVLWSVLVLSVASLNLSNAPCVLCRVEHPQMFHERVIRFLVWLRSVDALEAIHVA
jgi:hypothetical protein